MLTKEQKVLREKDLKTSRKLVAECECKTLKKFLQDALDWLEVDETRVLPRTTQEAQAAVQNGYPKADELMKWLAEQDTRR